MLCHLEKLQVSPYAGTSGSMEETNKKQMKDLSGRPTWLTFGRATRDPEHPPVNGAVELGGGAAAGLGHWAGGQWGPCVSSLGLKHSGHPS